MPAGPAAAEQDPRAVALAERTMTAMGGGAAWEATELLRFDFAVVREGAEVARYRHWWHRPDGRYRLEGTTREGEPFLVLFDLDDRRGRAWVAGRELAGEELDERLEAAYGRFVNDSYWLLMPWKWLDPGVNLAWVGERERDGRRFDVVRLTFGDGVGLTSNDRYDAFVAHDSGLMERWEYVLQDESGAPGTGEPTAWAWEGWTETEAGVRFATVRQRLGEGPEVRIAFPELRARRNVPADEIETTFAPPAAAEPASAGRERR